METFYLILLVPALIALIARLVFKVSITWLETAGYPTLNVGFEGGADDFEIITSEYAIDAFETGVDKGIVLSQ